MQNDFSSLRLLYVEDDDLVRQNAVEYLGRIVDTVLEAADGLEAYDIYTACKPDIIITDIKMPRINGLEFAKKIRKEDRITPIIITTAHTETDYLLQAVELQLIKYIIKPITAAKLQKALSLAYMHMSDSNIIMIDCNSTYDTLNKTVIISGEIVKLTKNERLLLDLLITHHQRVVHYREIEHYIWPDEGMSIDALRSLVRALRKKLQSDCIENISGVGYRCKITS